MTEQEFANQLVETLIEKTRLGRISWEEDQDEDFLANLPDGSALSLVGHNRPKGSFCFLTLFDSSAIPVARITSAPTSFEQSFVVPQLNDLWNTVRQQVPFRADEENQAALKNLLESLSKL